MIRTFLRQGRCSRGGHLCNDIVKKSTHAVINKIRPLIFSYVLVSINYMNASWYWWDRGNVYDFLFLTSVINHNLGWCNYMRVICKFDSSHTAHKIVLNKISITYMIFSIIWIAKHYRHCYQSEIENSITWIQRRWHGAKYLCQIPQLRMQNVNFVWINMHCPSKLHKL